ncbi:unnamed protein product [Brassicogethes aeneus]|uniref:Uncharacterized protein n=1 Tax=Brassicogethes aeneus TaxID=1431903 RepID=A0A9P0BBR9_BRAAE|nr:unnamed protein product [Brassicogethes aeneus]
MFAKKTNRRKGVVTTGKSSASNSLDWDSPSNKTGTVKRRPISTEVEDVDAVIRDAGGKYKDRSIYEPMSPLEKNGDKTLWQRPSKIPGYVPYPERPISSNHLPDVPKNPDDNQEDIVQCERPRNGPKWLPLSEQNSYRSGNSKVAGESFKDKDVQYHQIEPGGLREGRHSRESGSKTGKVSDSDSGIASPLSPGSVYGILGYLDRNNISPLPRCDESLPKADIRKDSKHGPEQIKVRK